MKLVKEMYATFFFFVAPSAVALSACGSKKCPNDDNWAQLAPFHPIHKIGTRDMHLGFVYNVATMQNEPNTHYKDACPHKKQFNKSVCTMHAVLEGTGKKKCGHETF